MGNYDNQSVGQAGQSMLSDDSGAGAAPAAQPEESSGSATALVAKSVCPGMKPGDTIPLKIEQVTDSQYVCSYEGGGAEESQETAPPSSASGGGQEDLMA